MPLRRPTAGILSCLSLLVLVSMGRAAELGDFDGDGRLSIADVVWRMNGEPAAAASVAGFIEDPCYAEWIGSGTEAMVLDSGFVYLESLRRRVPGSLSNWISLSSWRNWDETQGPLPTNREVAVQVQSASVPGGGDDRARITIR